jgi:N-carbamoyl-L-amino-acid hydrolase
LIELGMQIGIVTSIVGIRSFKIRFIGRADHAGTTPMDKRLDAAQGASAFTLAARELVMKEFPGYVATVGNMEFEPGVFNVVPHTVTVALEFRADDDDKLDKMKAALLKQASVEAQRGHRPSSSLSHIIIVDNTFGVETCPTILQRNSAETSSILLPRPSCYAY